VGQIRASIYALCLGGRILSFFIQIINNRDAKEFNRSVESALSIQGLALLCTSIYQTFRNQLTLFHAICVLHLLALLGINVIPRGEYSGNDRIRSFVKISLKISTLCVFIAFSVYVWAQAPEFGSQPKCNSSTMYVVFGVSIRATVPIFRWIILGTLAIVPACFIIVLLLSLPCWVTLCCLGNVIYTTPSTGHDSEDGHSQRNIWTSRSMKLAGYTAFSTYAIASLEQTISRNHVSTEERGWTFGQVIAIFLLLGTANEMLNAIISSRDSSGDHERGSD
jgi:hypothetical protein